MQWYKYLISPALVGLERERIRVVRTRCEGFGRQEPPLRFVPLGEMRVALVSAEHARQVEAVGQGQGLRINLRAADDENLVVPGKQRDGLPERMNHPAAGDFDLLARNDHIGTVRERAPERFVGFAAHDHGVPRRDGLEMFQVFGNMPEQRILIPDHAVFGNGNDDANHKFQILTSGGIAAGYNDADTAGTDCALRTTSAP